MQLILRQASLRGMPDVAVAYRDYVLGTGRLHAVWELIDRAFALAGFDLTWNLEGDDALAWSARLRRHRRTPPSLSTRPSSAPPTRGRSPPTRHAIRTELGWEPRVGLDVFLLDMLEP